MRKNWDKFACIWAVGAVVALGATIMNSCSSDDDYDLYQGDELKTYAAATRAGTESGGGPDDNDFLTSLKNSCGTGGCGVWCIGYLMSDKTYRGENKLLKKATELNSDWVNSGLNAPQMISLAQHVNVNLTSYISSQYKSGDKVITDQNRVANKILELGDQFSKKIVAVDGHWLVALTLRGNSVVCIDVNLDFEQKTKKSISDITQLIY